MNVSLTPELEQYVNQKVESGLYQTASEVIRAGLRLLKKRDEEQQASDEARRFNTFVSNYSLYQKTPHYQKYLKAFQANSLNTSIIVERQGSKDVITNYDGPAIVYAVVELDGTGLFYNAAVEACLDPELIEIGIDDVLGFAYDVTNEDVRSSRGYDDLDHSWVWDKEPEELAEPIRTVYPGWGLEYGKAYSFDKAVIKVPRGYSKWTRTHYQSVYLEG
jgi:putative addiction module CopG family antidote